MVYKWTTFSPVFFNKLKSWQSHTSSANKRSGHATQIECLLDVHLMLWTLYHLSDAVIRVCSSKQVFLGNFAKFTGKHLCQSLFLNKVAGLKLATILKKRLWNSCFPVNFGRIFKTTFFYRVRPIAASDFFISTQFRAYSKPYEANKLIPNIVNAWKPLTLSEKSSVFLACCGSEYAYGVRFMIILIGVNMQSSL